MLPLVLAPTLRDRIPDSLATDNLWCRIIRTPTTRLQEIPIRHDITQSKVTNLDIEIVIQQQAEEE